MSAIDKMMKEESMFHNSSFLFVCNVDRNPTSHDEAVMLKDYHPYVERYGESTVAGMKTMPIPGSKYMYRDIKMVKKLVVDR